MESTDLKIPISSPGRIVAETPEPAHSDIPSVKSESDGTGSTSAEDSLLLSGRKPEPSPDEKAAREAAKRLPRPEQNMSAKIIEIVNENNPKAMKTLRAIIASRAGLEKPPGTDLEQLEKTLAAAEQTPDPAKRIANVFQGVGLVPEELKTKFLEAAEKMLNLEAHAAREARPEPGGSIEIDGATGNYKPQNVNYQVKVDFDLFFSISSRSSSRSGEGDSGAFYEASTSVAAEFESNFSIEISGRFLSLADMAEAIDPGVLDAFSEAVQGLAGLDDDSLERFFDATEALFSEIEESLGLEKGVLSGTSERIKATAEGFMHSVSSAVAGAFPGVEVDQVFSLPAHLDENGSADLLTMMNGLLEKQVRQAEKADEKGEPLRRSLIAAENGLSLEKLMNMENLGSTLAGELVPGAPVPGMLIPGATAPPANTPYTAGLI